MKKQLVFAVAAISVAAAGLGTAGLVSADSATTTKTDHHARIRLEARLTQAERDGTITSAQEAAVKAELKTLQAERKAVIGKSSTKAERQAERSKLKQELQAWATANDFPLANVAPKLAS